MLAHSIFFYFTLLLIISQSISANPELRIVNGKLAKPKQFPHQTRIVISNIGFRCTGTIISKEYVLTAAKCVAMAKFDAGSLFVLYGKTENDNITRLQKAIVHEKYHKNSDEYDIALLKVFKPFIFNDYVKSIPLRKTMVPLGANITIAGYGVPITNELRYMETNVIECSDDFVRGICLKKDDLHGACNGDWGGAAIYENELIGIAFYVDPNCNNSYAGQFNVYTSVHFFYTWITEKME